MTNIFLKHALLKFEEYILGIDKLVLLIIILNGIRLWSQVSVKRGLTESDIILFRPKWFETIR